VWSRTANPDLTAAGIRVDQVADYSLPNLVDRLRGTDAVLSFITVRGDPDNSAQKALIHACIEAGVRRFAPSEWGFLSSKDHPRFKAKTVVSDYLEEINKDKTVLEYCLFQPGVFMDYYAHPYPQTKFLHTFPPMFDMENGRAVIVEDGTDALVVTTLSDVSKVVSQALDYEDPWPVVGGMVGTKTTMAEMIRVGEKIRGRPFQVYTIKESDLNAGEWKAEWLPEFSHRAFSAANAVAFRKPLMIMWALTIRQGLLNIQPTWNKLLPETKFEQLESYLEKCWEGK